MSDDINAKSIFLISQLLQRQMNLRATNHVHEQIVSSEVNNYKFFKFLKILAWENTSVGTLLFITS